jgi:polar amino acid transport system substrate-binding protein
MTNRLTTATAAVSLFALMAVGVAGCSTNASASTTAASGSAPLASEVPSYVKSKGTLTVGMTFGYTPWEMYKKDGKTQTGIEVDLLNAIGKQLGVKMDIQNVNFDGILAGTESGRYDLAVSGLGIYPERTKVIDFVPDAKTAYTFFAQDQYKDKLKTVDDLCGYKAGYGSGTHDQIEIQTLNQTVCKSDPIKATSYSDGNSQLLAMQNKKDDVSFLTKQVATTVLSSNPGKYYIGTPYMYVDFGIGVSKSHKDLSKAIADAETALIKDGTYDKILAKYGQSSAAIKSTQVVTDANTFTPAP